MLSISHFQMGQFGVISRDRFVRSMVDHLRGKFAARAAGMSDERLAEQVRLGMGEAKGHGVIYEDDIRRYLEYLVIHGTPLAQRPQAPWLAEILHNQALSGRRKLDLIGEYELQLLRSR